MKTVVQKHRSRNALKLGLKKGGLVCRLLHFSVSVSAQTEIDTNKS